MFGAMKPKANSPRDCGLCARVASLTRLTPLAQEAPAQVERPRFTTIQSTERNGRTVLVDFRAVTDISSRDLARFMEAMQRVASHGGHLALFGVREEVRRIFAIAQLDQVFHIYPTREAALSGEAGRSPSDTDLHFFN